MCYEIWDSEQVKSINHKYGIWNVGSWPKIKYMGWFALKIAMWPIFKKFGTHQNKLNMLIINIVLGIDYLDPKL